MLDNEGYVQKKKAADKVPNKTLLVPITGDKGLCGAANTSKTLFNLFVILTNKLKTSIVYL